MGFKDTIKSWIKDQYHYQKSDFSNVGLEIKTVGNIVYINSAAGVISFKFEEPKDIQRLREYYLNRLQSDESPFTVYRDILDFKWGKRTRIKYKANMKTKLRTKLVR